MLKSAEQLIQLHHRQRRPTGNPLTFDKKDEALLSLLDKMLAEMRTMRSALHEMKHADE